MGQEDLAARKSRGSTIDVSVGNKDLLGLVEVGDVTVSIDTAGEVAGTGTVTGSARDDGESEGLLVDLGSLDLGEAIDDGQNKSAQLIIQLSMQMKEINTDTRVSACVCGENFDSFLECVRLTLGSSNLHPGLCSWWYGQ